MTTRILIFLGTLIIGLGIIRYNPQWVSWTGKNQWAENKLGSGGTYTLWKLVAIAIIIFGFLVLIGEFVLAPEKPGAADGTGANPVQEGWKF